MQIRPWLRCSVVSLFTSISISSVPLLAASERCNHSEPVDRPLWGDLHVHTSYSLDANVFGTLATPADAYRFAKGKPLTRANGTTVKLERPLDFVAVTEHAEWLDFTAICDSDKAASFTDCQNLLTNRSPAKGSQLFKEYVVTTITGPTPEPLALCGDENAQCAETAVSRWESIQAQTEAAYEPCAFTTLHGYEWSHTPNFKHAHRNILFRTSDVTAEALDYIRYPTIEALWNALDENCLHQDGCEALTIPHNTNMGNGISFELSQATAKSLQQRGHYERLIEITQEKGTSECLPQDPEGLSSDCNFELFLTEQSRPTPRQAFSESDWQGMRSTYARSLIGRGLAFPGDSAPLRMGFIGSTDTHAATPGYVDEQTWSGSALAGAGFDGALRSNAWSAGGLVGVWARENTREAIFDALHRREVYATSGPRIALRFGLVAGVQEVCQAGDWSPDVNMGGIATFTREPTFHIQVQADTAPLSEVEIIKLVHSGGKIQEQVLTVWQAKDDAMTACIGWTDTNFDPKNASAWYPRVQQKPVPRWSAIQCESAGRCDDFPEMNSTIAERAWGSPIWHIPHLSVKPP